MTLLVALVLLIALLLISCVAQLALYIVAPRDSLYTGDLAANGRADYGYWADIPIPPALNADAVQAAPQEQTTPAADETPLPEESAPLVVIPAPSDGPVAVAIVSPSPTPSPSPTDIPPSPTDAPPPPTATRTATATDVAHALTGERSLRLRSPVSCTIVKYPPAAQPLP
ncbi:hypothetical protein K2Z83_08390 [Oscillochloris sp. ZM17-4]|uniref:hypothetical protein n=1 Tax=Oscillochloris sp. ZM17-4 TaxID=2866714 RepID=UPI001C731BCB|nr:hypothetical protein [Oscillochloris sp. ZM17-4]MBX0327695.1 hypothetical protein [Oscillochloris sp. ZM17-4]